MNLLIPQTTGFATRSGLSSSLVVDRIKSRVFAAIPSHGNASDTLDVFAIAEELSRSDIEVVVDSSDAVLCWNYEDIQQAKVAIVTVFDRMDAPTALEISSAGPTPVFYLDGPILQEPELVLDLAAAASASGGVIVMDENGLECCTGHVGVDNALSVFRSWGGKDLLVNHSCGVRGEFGSPIDERVPSFSKQYGCLTAGSWMPTFVSALTNGVSPQNSVNLALAATIAHHYSPPAIDEISHRDLWKPFLLGVLLGLLVVWLL